jgi:hypothetical protein
VKVLLPQDEPEVESVKLSNYYFFNNFGIVNDDSIFFLGVKGYRGAYHNVSSGIWLFLIKMGHHV